MGVPDDKLPPRVASWAQRGEDLAAQAEQDAEVVLNRHPLLARLYAATVGVIAKQSVYRLSLGAAGTAFWLVISVFPAVIAAIMVFGLVVDPTTIANDMKRVSVLGITDFGDILAQQAEQVASTDPGTLSVGLVISLIATLWSVSAGAYAMFRSIRLAYGIPPQHYVIARARAFGAAAVGVVLLGALVTLGAFALDWRDTLTPGWRIVFGLAAVPLVGAVIVLGSMALFRFGVAQRVPARSLLPGAVIASVVTLLLVFGVALFGNYAKDYQAIYGTVSGVVVVLLAVYTLMYVLLLSAVFNAEWEPLPQEAGMDEQEASVESAAPMS